MTPPSTPATVDDLPADVTAVFGAVQYPETGEFPVERGYIWSSCASVENGNPLFWDDAVASALTDGPVAPPTMVSVWFRPHHWAPGRTGEQLPLKTHFDLKARFGLPEAVMTDNTIVFHEPVRPGDVLRTHQVLRSVSAPKTTKLGTGRFWEIDVIYRNPRGDLVAVERYTGFGYRRVGDEGRGGASAVAALSAPEASSGDGSEGGATSGPPSDPASDPGVAPATNGTAPSPRLVLGDVHVGDQLPELRYDVTATTVVLGALRPATRDWRPMHHDKDFAVERNGVRNIFLNTPNQAAWFERYITDWTGAHGRMGRVTFRMKGSVFAGDTMALNATVDEVGADDTGCGWMGLSIALTVEGDVKTTATARIAVPTGPGDNPWRRRGDEWQP